MKAKYEKFAELLEKYDTNATRIARATGISSPIFSYWKQGRNVGDRTIRTLANYFNVPEEFFYEKPIPKPKVITNEDAAELGIDADATNEKIKVIDRTAMEIATEMEKLSDSQKAAVLEIIRQFIKSNWRI